MSDTAAVVIGRNEGPRLSRALRSVLGQCAPVVYVDSASTDGSPETARALGADVVALDMSIAFTFGRARNRGTERVLELAPNALYVQFVDADSEIVTPWLQTGRAALDADAGVGAVHGRVRERRTNDTIYDRLYSLEFDPRCEDPKLFGGMAMLRIAAMNAVGGYLDTLQTFEDHDLSLRLRRAGWRVQRVDADMAIHESRMTRCADWWQRERRAGHARAQLFLHGAQGDEGPWRRSYVSIWFWAVAIPMLALVAIWQSTTAAVGILLAYPATFGRIFVRMRRNGFPSADAALYAAGRVVGKFPQFHGLLSALRERNGAR